MTIQLNIKNRKIIFENHKDNLQEIYDLYWEKQFYTIHYGDFSEEYSKPKYPVKFIMEKFGLNNNAELIYLVAIKSEYLGKCNFCGEEKYKYNTRSSSNNTTCDCTANCEKCKKPGSRGEIQKGFCYSCTSREEYQEEDQENYFCIENKYIGCLLNWDIQSILQHCTIQDMEIIIKEASKKIMRLKKIKKLLE